MAQAGQARARADGAQHETLMAVLGRGFLDRLPRQFASQAVQLESLVGEIEFGQGQGRAAETVGLHDVGTGLQIAGMDLPHDVRAAHIQNFGAIFRAAIILLHIQVHGLDAAAEGPVAQKHALG